MIENIMESEKLIILHEIGSKIGNYEIIEILFKNTYKVKQTGSDKIFIIKQILNSPLVLGYFAKLKEISHPNLVSIIEFFELSNCLYIVYPFFEEGNLKNLILTKGKFSETKSISVFQQILKGYQILTINSQNHYNLNLESIFLDSMPTPYYKLGDFCDNEVSLKNAEIQIENIKELGKILYFMLSGKMYEYNNQEKLEEISKNCLDFMESLIQNKINFPEIYLNPIVANEIQILSTPLQKFQEKQCQCKINKPISLNCKHSICLVCAYKHMKDKKMNSLTNPFIQPPKFQCHDCKLYCNFDKIKLSCGCIADLKIKGKSTFCKSRIEPHSIFLFQ